MHEQKVSNRRQLILQKDLNCQKIINPRVTCWKQHFFSLPMLAVFPNFIYTEFVQATFKSSKLSELLALFRNPKTCSRLPQILELLPT